MKKLLVLLAVLALAAPAMAGIDPGPNGIGVYFDLGANINCAQPAPYALLNMYLIATNITESSGISGWETHVYFNPVPGAGVTYTYAGVGAVNPLTAPDFQVGMGGGPLPYSPAVLMLTMSTFYLGGPLSIGLGPITTAPTSFPLTRSPGYAAGNDPSKLVALKCSSNWPWLSVPNAFLVAGANAGDCPVPTEDTSWGGVKALYQ
jgi:hypothetical protein